MFFFFVFFLTCLHTLMSVCELSKLSCAHLQMCFLKNVLRCVCVCVCGLGEGQCVGPCVFFSPPHEMSFKAARRECCEAAISVKI